MNWPFVTRRAYDLVAAELTATKRELHRWEDIVAKRNWGHQIHDTLPVAVAEQLGTEEPLPPAQETEEELQAAEHRHDQAQLAVIARTRKSLLPAAMERFMGKRLVQRAKAAVAKPIVAKDETRRAVADRFEKLKAETIRSIH